MRVLFVGPFPFYAFAPTFIDGSTLGGYFQIVHDPANPLNGGSAALDNTTIIPALSVLALLGLGLVALIARQRR